MWRFAAALPFTKRFFRVLRDLEELARRVREDDLRFFRRGRRALVAELELRLRARLREGDARERVAC